jgi:glycerol-1-phosphate dehydrogenase [NAD(P)+]
MNNSNNVQSLLPSFTPSTVPTSLTELLEFSTSCPCGTSHSVDLKEVSIRRGALDDLIDSVRREGQGLNIVVVADDVTKSICGDRIVQMLNKDGHHAALFIAPSGKGGRPHADEQTLAAVSSALPGFQLGIAAGSGTINDLVKLASFQTKIPYIAVATAPSMNGYTSAIAAMMIRGVKRTVPCRQPVAVIADIDILKDAPLPLIAAGLGDLESKPTATADYRLGAIVRGDTYCRAPEGVVLVAEDLAAKTAEGLPRRDEDAIHALTEALILSGISMKLAGSSSPASGGEHLISHLWDMTASAENRIEELHGAQVGVATIVTATLYEHLFAINPSTIDIDRIISSRLSLEEEAIIIRRMHGPFADEVEKEYGRKRPSDEVLGERLNFLKDRWTDLFFALKDVLRPAYRIRETLRQGGAPTDVDALHLTPLHLRRALLYARHIRDRYTVLDLAFDVGILEADTDVLLKKAGC